MYDPHELPDGWEEPTLPFEEHSDTERHLEIEEYLDMQGYAELDVASYLVDRNATDKGSQ